MTESSPLELSEETLKEWEGISIILMRGECDDKILSLIQALRRSQEKLRIAEKSMEIAVENIKIGRHIPWYSALQVMDDLIDSLSRIRAKESK